MATRLLLVLAVSALVLLGGCLGDIDTGENPFDDSDDGDSGATDEPAVDIADDLDGDDHLELHHIDVGQGDATLAIDPSGETMLIDSGDWRDDGDTVIDYLESLGVDRIDHLVATHAHADHIGGHAAIIEHFETEGEGIGAVYDSGVAHTSQTYENYLDAIEAHDLTPLTVEEGDSLEFGESDVAFFNPPAGDSGTDLHYNSVALTITYGDVTYLTTGDAETDAESRMLDEHGEALDADVYHAGHHGSSTSSTAPFMGVVDPAVAVISSAYDSQYGHPHDEVLERFADHGIETYWTGIHDDVVIATDGEALAVSTASDGPTDGEALLEEKPDEDDQSAIATHTVDGAGSVTVPP